MAAKRELINTGTDKPLLLTRHRAGSDQLPLTHEFLSMIATGTLQQAGFIQIAGGNIAIIDVESLEEVSCECYRLIRD